MQNPFTLSFGKIPTQYISRLRQKEEIMESFRQEPPSNQAYMLIGVRGSGKTVLLSTVCKEFRADPDWIVIDLNPTRDLLQSFAAQLYSDLRMAAAFIQAKIDLSVFGIGVTIEKAVPVSDIEAALHRMLEIVKSKGKKVLLAVDEVSNTAYMREFASAFQIMVRNDLPVYLIMTGLFENVQDLQNVDNLTFLYRMPKIMMDPLNFTAVRNQYKDTLQVDDDTALKMAKLVRGYSFGFQVLGYLYWENDHRSLDKVIPQFDQYLDEYVYGKIWSELSEKDKAVAAAIAASDDHKVSSIRKKLEMSSSLFSIYRERLRQKGIIDTEEHGHILFALPRFGEYVLQRAE